MNYIRRLIISTKFRINPQDAVPERQVDIFFIAVSLKIPLIYVFGLSLGGRNRKVSEYCHLLAPKLGLPSSTFSNSSNLSRLSGYRVAAGGGQ